MIAGQDYVFPVGHACCIASRLLWSVTVLLATLLSDTVTSLCLPSHDSVRGFGEAPITFGSYSCRMLVCGSCCCHDVKAIDSFRDVDEDCSLWNSSCDGSWLDGCCDCPLSGPVLAHDGSRVSMLAVPWFNGSSIAFDVYEHGHDCSAHKWHHIDIESDANHFSFLSAACLIGEISVLLSMHDCSWVSGLFESLVIQRDVNHCVAGYNPASCLCDVEPAISICGDEFSNNSGGVPPYVYYDDGDDGLFNDCHLCFDDPNPIGSSVNTIGESVPVTSAMRSHSLPSLPLHDTQHCVAPPHIAPNISRRSITSDSSHVPEARCAAGTLEPVPDSGVGSLPLFFAPTPSLAPMHSASVDGLVQAISTIVGGCVSFFLIS